MGRAERSTRAGWFLSALLALAVLGCTRPGFDPRNPPELVSAYRLFAGAAVDQRPAPGVIPYSINTPLFSDYAEKLRFLKLPPGGEARYRADGPFEFPVGTVIAKTFAFPADLRAPQARLRLLETRILVHTSAGWIGLPYICNEAQTEARLELTGGRAAVSVVHPSGERLDLRYNIPNANQCKGCHRVKGRAMQPIGPQAGQLNRPFAYAHGEENQLAYWRRSGALTGAPEPAAAPRTPVWDDPSTGTLDQRARAWLDINCAHCHNPGGPARSSGLDLSQGQRNPTLLGFEKSPIAAGRGSGDRLVDIAPGRPEDSILLLRLESIDPGIMMPELGRSIVHREGVALVREWIASLAPRAAGG